jgi:proline dehydrogenase
MTNQSPISFNNTEYAFAYKKNAALKKAHFLFTSMGKPWLINWGLKFTPLAIKWHLPFTKTIIRSTIFNQFVGGETLEQTATVAKNLHEYHVQVILDYGVEGGDDGEEGFDNATQEFIKVINYAATQPNIPFMSIKVTGFSRFTLLEKIDALMNQFKGTLMKRYLKAVDNLTEIEKEEWHKVRVRMLRICEAAAKNNIGVLVDAEETWIQDPVDALTILMMDTFNRTKAVVYNTIQLYRHDRLQFLKDSFNATTERDFILGAKLVRGAYMEKERKRAIEKNYTSPIQITKQLTDNDYNDAVIFCLQNIKKIAVIIATHNEESNMHGVQIAMQQNIPLNHPHIHFSQLYGMSDNITFNLAKANCSVSKYLPFGPIKDVIPYLMRRAQENSSVSGQTGRELTLIKKELQRRMYL